MPGSKEDAAELGDSELVVTPNRRWFSSLLLCSVELKQRSSESRVSEGGWWVGRTGLLVWLNNTSAESERMADGPVV